jgi:cytochrome c peroxidase
MRLKRVALALPVVALLPACGGELDEGPAEEVVVVESALNLTFAQHQTRCTTDPRVQAGQVSLNECIGADIFFIENFNGNGRTCATCHRLERNFAIDPAFIAQLPLADPLFVAETNAALAQLEIPAQMRARSLILENVDGTAPQGPTTRFVLRSVPHNLSMSRTIATPTPGIGPAERTGWSADGAPGAGLLSDFTQGAVVQHFTRSLNRVAGPDFRNATAQEGQAVATFMRELGRKNEINLAAVTFSDAAANTGRQRFLAVGCNPCHNNAGSNTGGANQNFNTNVEVARNAALAAFPRDGGLGNTGANPPNPIGNLTFNSAPLIEAADTGPFFHTDTTVSGAPAFNTPSANTIEQAVAFYGGNAFAARPGGGGQRLPINAADITNIGRFLRGLNAIFNIQMASNRILGARNVGSALGDVIRVWNMHRRMAQMTLFELDDAIRVLAEVNLNPVQANQVRAARTQIENVINLTSHQGTGTVPFGNRMTAFTSALTSLNAADGGIANVTFTIGNGTRMDCAAPSAAGTEAPCFNPVLRNRPN